jgi:predicted AAA+ superfamily ATPase
MLLATAPEPLFFEEWIDSFYARDIMELFGVRNRVGFLSLLKLLFLGISRPTVMAYIESLRISHVISRIPPFHGGSHREIIRQPKTYAFDTGIISHVRGWNRIRETDRGHLWENLVLDELRASFPETALHYWRDKNRREIDFVIVHTSSRIDTVEAKINPNAFNSSNLKAFRDRYPEGNDYLVCPYVKDPYQIPAGERPITVCGIEHFSKRETY